MSGAMDKEKIYEELRNYHTNRFPEKIKNPRVNDLRIEFGEMEDSIIGMILSLISGNTEFVDATKELATFEDKLQTVMPTEGNDANRNLFATKIKWLGELLVMAKEANFKLRPIRIVRTAIR
jgi:hypothetical protein